jgi:PAS domain S-box-containing protein
MDNPKTTINKIKNPTIRGVYRKLRRSAKIYAIVLRNREIYCQSLCTTSLRVFRASIDYIYFKVVAPPLEWFFHFQTIRELKLLSRSLQENPSQLPAFKSALITEIATCFSSMNDSVCQSSQSLEKSFYTSPFPLLLTTKNEDRIVAMNEIFSEFSGLQLGEVHGRRTIDLNFWVNPKQYTEWNKLIVKMNSVTDMEMLIRCHKHKKTSVKITSESILINGNELILSSFKDISNQKVIEAKLNYSYKSLTEILEGIQDVFFGLDTGWRFTFVNRQTPFLLNRKPEDLMGKNIWEVFHSLVGTIYQTELTVSMEQKTIANFQAPSFLGDQWYEISAYPTKNGLSVLSRNISSQKRISDTLERSYHQIADILESIPQVFFSLDYNWRFIYLNQQAEKYYKSSREVLVGKRIWDEYPETAGTGIAEQYHKVMSEQKPVFYEGPSPLSDKYFAYNIYPTTEGLSVYMHDITEQKMIELAHINTEERFSNILDSIGDPVFVLDNQWRIAYLNKVFERYIPHSREEYIGKYMWEIHPHYTSSSLYQRFYQVMKECHPLHFEEYDFISNSWMDFNVYNYSSGLVVCLRDITERKKAEDELTQSHRRIATILESITDAFYTLDRNWQFTDSNKIAETIWQRGKEQLLAKNIWNEYPQLIGTLIDSEFHRAITEQNPVHFEAFNPIMQGWAEIHAYPDENGLTVYSRDISLRKKMEENSSTERELLLITLRSIGDGVIAVNRDGKVILINKTAEELTGWSYDEAVGLPLNRVFYVIDDKTSEQYEHIVTRIINGGETLQLPNAVLINREFKEIMIANSCAPIRSAEGEVLGVVIVFKDITEKLKTEAELLKAQKIESLGVLAGGIAHDFNNFLAAILANIQLTVLRLDKGLDIRKSLNEAIEATKKASDLTKQLLTFAKGGAPVKKFVSLSSLLEETTNFHLRGSKVKCEFNIPADLWQVEVDPGQFSQVISNLVINAQQAMAQGGSIEICAENVTVGDDNNRLSPGKYVKIVIKDHGVGIPEENLSKIFDPFFTTKQSGSGLGLATSYSIIRQHGGYIDLATRVGVGTTFFIYLPATDSQFIPETPQAPVTLNGEGKILVMDDESMIRDVVAEMLNLLGYQVVTAKDGLETIQLYRESLDGDNPFTLVIMDLTIPGGMGGLETISQLCQIDPEVKAIVSSGYANDPVMADYENYGFCGMVLKPFKIEELSDILNRALLASGSGPLGDKS